MRRGASGAAAAPVAAEVGRWLARVVCQSGRRRQVSVPLAVGAHGGAALGHATHGRYLLTHGLYMLTLRDEQGTQPAVAAGGFRNKL